MSDKIYYVKLDYLLKALANGGNYLIIDSKIRYLTQLLKPEYHYCQDSKEINELHHSDPF
jgi:hypothetical protein